MNTAKLAVSLLAFCATVAWAQETVPAVEAGVNMSFLSTYPGGGAPSFTAAGGSATFVYNFNKVFSGVADLGGYHNPSDTNFNPTTFTYLFGPRISLRRSRFTPYAQTLFGGARQWTSFADPTTGVTTANDGFAAAFGGGMDVRLTDHVMVKPAQIEYLLTKVTNPWNLDNHQDNIRYSAGVVFTFGAK